ncbi:MAG: hypothetical protein MR966_03125 [Lachnospiraceae bacterium]|nr:hypothetical protein [Lachnospiraceae bacterium]
MFELIFGMVMLYLIGALVWSLFTAYPALFVIVALVAGFLLIYYLIDNGNAFSALLFPVEGAGTGLVAGFIMRALLGDENILYNFVSEEYVVPIITIVGCVVGLFFLILYVDEIQTQKQNGKKEDDCYAKYAVNTIFVSIGIESAFGILVLITTGAVLIGGVILIVALIGITYFFHLF